MPRGAGPHGASTVPSPRLGRGRGGRPRRPGRDRVPVPLRLTSVERGRRLAETQGCFACHGPEGTRGAGNPGRSDRTVPTYGSLMMYATNREEVRQWIADGVSRTRAQSETWRKERARGVLQMPAYGDRLTKRQIDDLVAFVLAAAGEARSRGFARARGPRTRRSARCTGCHGDGGRYSRRNPGSLKGYVPSWDGDDWPELVRDEAEFREWVERESAPGWNRTRSRGFPRPGGAPDAGVPGSPGAG